MLSFEPFADEVGGPLIAPPATPKAWHILLPDDLAVAKGLVERFIDAVKKFPETFENGNIWPSICRLKKYLEEVGACLEDLGHKQRAFFHYIKGLLASSLQSA
ncbi:MAG: hypothetical protein JWL82_506 [Parcubacteria group bacterium]|nr:hypothetical protein [Parcubacteria group bacterium]